MLDGKLCAADDVLRSPGGARRRTAPLTMRRRLFPFLLAAAALGAGSVGVVPAAAQDAVPGEVVVQYDHASEPQVVQVPDGQSVDQAIHRLRDAAGVRYAVPNVIAHASGFIPN